MPLSLIKKFLIAVKARGAQRCLTGSCWYLLHADVLFSDILILFLLGLFEGVTKVE